MVPSKIVRRSSLANPISLAASMGERARPGGHEENWFLRKKLLAPAGGARLLDFGLNRGNEEKWFRKENVRGTLFVAELEGLPESR